MLTQDEELRLARLARTGDEYAFDHMVTAHFPLAYAMAWQYRSHGVALDDLIGEAMLGLVKAARDFDPERGVRLAGYAALWIRAYLRRFTLENRRIVRGPGTRNARRVLAGLRRVERELERQHGCAPADAVADALGVTVAEVEEMRSVLSARDVVAGHVLERHRELPAQGPSPEACVADTERRKLTSELIRGALACLEPRKRGVLVLRRLKDTPPTLADVGRELRLSRERVRQIEAEAQDELRVVVEGALTARNIPLEELCAA